MLRLSRRYLFLRSGVVQCAESCVLYNQIWYIWAIKKVCGEKDCQIQGNPSTSANEAFRLKFDVGECTIIHEICSSHSERCLPVDVREGAMTYLPPCYRLLIQCKIILITKGDFNNFFTRLHFFEKV